MPQTKQTKAKQREYEEKSRKKAAGAKGKEPIFQSKGLSALAKSVEAKAETQADAIEAPEGAQAAPADQPIEPGGKITATPSPTPPESPIAKAARLNRERKAKKKKNNPHNY
jgi:hypothetical protein